MTIQQRVRQMIVRQAMTVALGILGWSISSPALAIETYFNWMVPAAACAPRVDTDQSKVILSSGTWIFASGQSGTVDLICPVHKFENIKDSVPSNKAEQGKLWYRDPDGTSTASRVTAQLKRRQETDATASSVGGLIDSNGSTTTTFTTKAASIAHSMSGSYHIVVTLSRSNANAATPVFVGYQFAPPLGF